MIHGISNLTLFSLRPGVISTGPEGLNDPWRLTDRLDKEIEIVSADKSTNS
jgi:hypothetical protein